MVEIIIKNINITKQRKEITNVSRGKHSKQKMQYIKFDKADHVKARAPVFQSVTTQSANINSVSYCLIQSRNYAKLTRSHAG